MKSRRPDPRTAAMVGSLPDLFAPVVASRFCLDLGSGGDSPRWIDELSGAEVSPPRKDSSAHIGGLFGTGLKGAAELAYQSPRPESDRLGGPALESVYAVVGWASNPSAANAFAPADPEGAGAVFDMLQMDLLCELVSVR